MAKLKSAAGLDAGILSNIQLILTLLTIALQLAVFFKTLPITNTRTARAKIIACVISLSSLVNHFLVNNLKQDEGKQETVLFLVLTLTPLLCKIFIGYYDDSVERILMRGSGASRARPESFLTYRYRLCYLLQFFGKDQGSSQREQLQMFLVLKSFQSQTAAANSVARAEANEIAHYSSGKQIAQVRLQISYRAFSQLVRGEIDRYYSVIATKRDAQAQYMYLQYIMVLIEHVSPQLALSECYKSMRNSELNASQRLVLSYLQVKASAKMEEDLSVTLANRNIYRQSEEYIRICDQRQKSLDGLRQLLMQKQNLYEQIIKEQFRNVRELYGRLWEVSRRSYGVQKHLEANFEKSPCSFENKLLLVYYAEVYQYYYKANDLVKNYTLIQQNYYKAQHQWIAHFDEEELDQFRLSVSLGIDQGALVSYSEQLPAALNYRSSDFSYIKRVEQLIPPPVSQIHSQLVQRFLTGCQSRFLNDFQAAFLTDAGGYIIPVQIYFRVNNSLRHNNLLLEVFIRLRALDVQSQTTQENSVFVITNADRQILAITQNFSSLTGVAPQEAEGVHRLLKRLSMDSLLYPEGGASVLDRSFTHASEAYLPNARWGLPADTRLSKSLLLRANIRIDERHVAHAPDEASSGPPADTELVYYIYQFSSITEDASDLDDMNSQLAKHFYT